MNFLALAEAQGMTPQMIRDHLNSHGWPGGPCQHSYPVCANLSAHTEHARRPGSSSSILIPDDWSTHWGQVGLRTALGFVAASRGMSDQDLLREINPRMRKGVPSTEAIKAHEDRAGHWLAQSAVLPHSGCLRVGYFDNMHGFVIYELAHRGTITFFEIADSWSFWPCDAHGNKVRWPEHDGVML